MNKVELVGRLTRDPEVRYTQTNNTLVATFSLAIRRRFVREGDTQTADFINCVAWSKTGEFVSKYFKKGQMMEVVGRIQTRSYDDSNGQKRYVTEVIAEEVGFVGKTLEIWEKILIWVIHQILKYHQVMIYHSKVKSI